MSTARRILVVEDERDLADMVAYNLTKAGHLPIVAHDGIRAVQLAHGHPPDLVVLDLMLPGLSGLDVARELRGLATTAMVPILMLTARAEEADQVAGLAVGADDYVTKPFSMKVLLARIEALLRRVPPQPEQEGQAGTVSLGPIVADLAAHGVTVDGVPARLTVTEFKLLVALLQNQRRVLSRADLIARVMGPGIIVTARTIDVHVASIRKKLGPYGHYVRTIRGVGYQLVVGAEETAEESQR